MSSETQTCSTVLVVEDEGVVRMVAVDLLEDAGFEVLEAESADAALAVLEDAAHVGVLFTDVDMPGSMDGVALAALVAERWPHIKLVVTSGRVRIQGDAMPDSGCFLAKPYRQKQLLAAIDEAG